MHDEIIRYSLTGEVNDDDLAKTRERLITFLESQMREEGCIPSLDLDPLFTLDYSPETERYAFSLSVYGVFVGGTEAWQKSGVTSGKTISKFTPRVKLKDS